ncbi:MAG: 50S ribosomal protein L17 [Acidobacteria bacterium]|nr:50S ribosomal protein L17 [Acidobacteriota bacterium]
MRHKVAHRKLGRVTEHRISLLRNQAEALLRHERIQTTVPKAKELRPFVEHIITLAKRGVAADSEPSRTLHFRRLVLRDIADRTVVSKLFDDLAPRFSSRPGGYTRLLRLGFRRGDSAEVAQVELVGSEYTPAAKTEAEGAGEKPKPKGVGDRLRAAAERVRRRKGGEEGEGAGDQVKARTKPPRVAQKRTTPTKGKRGA